jgi:uncharacterized protein (DUF302 family)
MDNTTKQANLERFTVTSSKPFESVVAAFESSLGHPNLSQVVGELGATKTYAEMEGVVQAVVGKSGLIEFVRFDLGAVLRKGAGPQTPRILRFLIGNPLVMKEMVKHVPEAGSYAPVTVLIDERPDGVHLSYDTMAGFLAPYGNPHALKVARDLDSKVENLLTEAAA